MELGLVDEGQVKGPRAGSPDHQEQRGRQEGCGSGGRGGMQNTELQCPRPCLRPDFRPSSSPHLTPHLHMGKSRPRGGKGFLPKISQGALAESGLRFTTLALLLCQYKMIFMCREAGNGLGLDPSFTLPSCVVCN